MTNLISTIANQMETIIALQKSNKATKKDLINLAILTKFLTQLNDNN